MSDEPTLTSTDAPEEPPSTDPGGHAPPASTPPDLTLRQVAELVLGALDAHQTAELEHHRRVELQLHEILEQERSFGQRLTELERRVGRLEALAKTDRPAPFADASEPGGDP